MKLINARNIIILALTQIGLGLGFLFEPFSNPLIEAFYAPLAANKQLTATHALFDQINENNELVIQPYGYSKADQGKSIPVLSLHESSSQNSFVAYPPAPMDYTVLFRHLYEQGAEKVYVLSPLIWSDTPDPIIQEAIGYELDRFPFKGIGQALIESNRQESLPEYLKEYAILPEQIIGDTSKLPLASRWHGGNPQIITKAKIYPTFVENSDVDDNATDKSMPLFVKWDKHIVPTLPLIAVMNRLGLKGKDIKAHLNGKLYLGSQRTVEIDNYARVDTLESLPPTMISTESIIIPNIPGMVKEDNQALKTILNEADAIIVSEPSKPSNSPDDNAIIMAKTIHTLMAGIAPLPQVTYSAIPTWALWVVLLDLLILTLWSIKFSPKNRNLTLLAQIVGVMIFSYIFFVYLDLWFQFTIPITMIVVITIGSYFLPQKVVFEEIDKPAKNYKNEPPAPDTLVIEQEPIFQEPSAIPIPKKAE